MTTRSNLSRFNGVFFVSDSNPPSLYAAREPIFPRRVSGAFRNLKWIIMIVTLGIYYITPWIRWDRGPALPDQAVLVDLANRRFFFFMIEIWPHEFYFIAGLLVMAGLGLFLFTSALGRVWCGYACPQTVWTDLFILVERWVEGDRNARLRLHRHKKWDFRKARLRLTKWIAWLLIAVATGGAWVFYFTDAPTLLVDLFTMNAHPVAYTTVAILTATTFFFGGIAREQICIYACPWPRIQAAMMDEDTLVVGYRSWRGEPRGKLSRAVEGQEQGDCIDCMACVNVCPVGIDIRDGQQLECITCALCIDACDDVMEKSALCSIVLALGFVLWYASLACLLACMHCLLCGGGDVSQHHRWSSVVVVVVVGRPSGGRGQTDEASQKRYLRDFKIKL